jgi:hypothetical protein
MRNSLRRMAFGALSVPAFLGAAAAVLFAIEAARSHPVTDVAGKPTGDIYDPSCCRSAATSPTGDCAPIDDQYVREGPDGYEINLPVGAHPKLKNKGYSGVVPYRQVKQPIDNRYHLCVSQDGGHRFCFYPKPGAV